MLIRQIVHLCPRWLCAWDPPRNGRVVYGSTEQQEECLQTSVRCLTCKAEGVESRQVIHVGLSTE